MSLIPYNQRAVVCVAYNGNYRHGADRLNAELTAVGYRGARMIWSECSPIGSPDHIDLPYAFKVHAVGLALQAGFTAVIWLDSSVWPGLSLDPVFDEMERTGAYLVHDGGCMGHWCTDEALAELGWTREMAMQEPIVAGGIWGVYYPHPSGRAFYEGLREMMTNPKIVRGHWRKAHGSVSVDERVQGHRHDMPAMTALARRIGLKPNSPGVFLYGSSYPTPSDDRRQWHLRGV